MEKRRQASQSFWALVWRQFKKNRLALAATWVLVFLFLVALLHPFIVGTRPIVCYYKGEYYFPAMSYYNPQWENLIFKKDKFRFEYASKLVEKDPESWAVWPLVYGDPYRKLQADKDWKLQNAEFKRRDEVALLQVELAGRADGSKHQVIPPSPTPPPTSTPAPTNSPTPEPSATPPPGAESLPAEAAGATPSETPTATPTLTPEPSSTPTATPPPPTKTSTPPPAGSPTPTPNEQARLQTKFSSMADDQLKARLAELEAAKPQWKHEPSVLWKDRPDVDNNQPPNRYNLFGTDDLGRDVFARIVHGTPIALLVGFLSMGIATTIGIILGSMAGFFGGAVDTMLTRLMDIVLSVPSLIFILAIIAIVPKPTIWHMMVVIGMFGWVGIARLIRGEFMRLRNMEFTIAAQAQGASNFRIMFRHLLPNALAPVLVSISFGIAGAILTESGLSFLGFGVQPPTPSWGAVLHDGFGLLGSNFKQWWQIVFPGFMIFVAVFVYNLVGDGLQEAMDPRLKR